MVRSGGLHTITSPILTEFFNGTLNRPLNPSSFKLFLALGWQEPCPSDRGGSISYFPSLPEPDFSFLSIRPPTLSFLYPVIVTDSIFCNVTNCIRFDMPSRREQGRKGQGGSRRVYFTDEENEGTVYHGSPAVNNTDINSTHGSPGRPASSSTSHSQQSHHSHASPQNNRLGTPGPSTPVPTTGQAATPTPGAPGIATTTGSNGNPIIMTQQTFPGPSMPPMPICPPDPLGPPPPPPPPQAILPVVNPMGVHFQPQVPATDQGPMIHRYIPRFDPPCTSYPAPQMGPYMVSTNQQSPSDLSFAPI